MNNLVTSVSEKEIAARLKSGKLTVLIPDGESQFALFVVRCLGQVPNLRLHVLSNEPWVPIRLSRHRHTFRRCLMDNEAQRLAVIYQTLKETETDVILPIDEPTSYLVSKNREEMAKVVAIPPLSDPDTFQAVINKWALADLLRRHDIPVPKTILYKDDEQFARRLADMQFPVLIKPAIGKGGEGIHSFENRTDLLNYIENNPAVNSKQHIIQQFVHGHDIDCSILCENGKILAYTIQKGIVTGLQSFAASAGVQFLHNDQVWQVVNQFVAATQFSGIAHLDLRFDKEEQVTKIIEVNARYWGSLIGSLIVGVNFPYLACLAALNIAYPQPDYRFGRYVAGEAAIRQGFKRIVSKNGIVDFTYGDTNLPHALGDPFAEALKIFRQAVFKRR